MSSNAGRAAMARYDDFLQMAEAMWQRERAAKVPVDGGWQ
jgi:hypothetical protein